MKDKNRLFDSYFKGEMSKENFFIGLSMIEQKKKGDLDANIRL